MASWLTSTNQLSGNPTLRRSNYIRTIHGFFAIEQNTLSLEQVTAVLNGKHVLAPPKDITEVKSAYEIYMRLDLAKNSDLQILIHSCVFHYEFELIHPFADGHDRVGHLWHTLLLSKWISAFA